MKKSILLGLLILSITTINSFGQSAEKKGNIALGIGTNCYNGDLGNPWFHPDDEWYGIGTLSYSRYISKSFDASLTFTSGDYGKCREEGDPQFRPDGSEVLNMLSRLTTGTMTVRYKFANGYLLKENSRISPYVYVGAGVNNISEYWWENKDRANVGYYASYNGGAGVRYNLSDRFNITYNLGFGYFATDSIDKRTEGRNDMYMQNTVLFGMSF